MAVVIAAWYSESNLLEYMVMRKPICPCCGEIIQKGDEIVSELQQLTTPPTEKIYE